VRDLIFSEVRINRRESLTPCIGVTGVGRSRLGVNVDQPARKASSVVFGIDVRSGPCNNLDADLVGNIH
jgi:hypothetical protein